MANKDIGEDPGETYARDRVRRDGQRPRADLLHTIVEESRASDLNAERESAGALCRVRAVPYDGGGSTWAIENGNKLQR